MGSTISYGPRRVPEMRGIEEIYRFEHRSSTERTRPSLRLVTTGKTYELG